MSTTPDTHGRTNPADPPDTAAGEWEVVPAIYEDTSAVMSAIKGHNLRACPACAAVVSRDGKQKHIDWHTHDSEDTGP